MAQGQLLVLPDIEIEGWRISLDAAEDDEAQIIPLYGDHATAEQFHSECKTDLDIEGCLQENSPPTTSSLAPRVGMSLSAYSYNILRKIGLIGLPGEQSLIRRRRIKTVIKELMYLAARLIPSGHRLKLPFSQVCPSFIAFESTYAKLAVG